MCQNKRKFLFYLLLPAALEYNVWFKLISVVRQSQRMLKIYSTSTLSLCDKLIRFSSSSPYTTFLPWSIHITYFLGCSLAGNTKLTVTPKLTRFSNFPNDHVFTLIQNDVVATFCQLANKLHETLLIHTRWLCTNTHFFIFNIMCSSIKSK